MNDSTVFTEEFAPPAGIFGDYRPLPELYDEMALAQGRIRPHWQSLVNSLSEYSSQELQLRWEQASRVIREHGVTYNVYGDPQGTDRPWDLDPIPFIVTAAEWRIVEEGIIQRNKLFNLILADLYGPQKLLHEGLLPPALVLSNPRFLRPCQGINVVHQTHLHLHAADLARSSNGQWWVLSDRTQAPSGAGYALENRIVLSRIFPDQFRECQTQRLVSFFRSLRDNLRSLAIHNRENPNIVLLTPGPFNETYFEHAYLARYLGLILVEGGDLTVRNRRVFIKTLAGLQPVDVILRRVDDSFCDPLELRDDSFLGVSGLVEAVRAGNVAIANALGSGLLESPAFLAFLPGLCRHFLGEELKMPSVATWWCGQKKEREYVLDHLDQIVVKPAFGAHSYKPFFGENMSSKEREDLIAAIHAHPSDFVGQEQVELSTIPVWMNDELEPRPLVLRSYVAANGDSFNVMPGGLARVSTTSEDPIVSMQSGGGSKDIWVMSEEPVTQLTLLLNSVGTPIHSTRSAGEVPSRVADYLFWLGRYTERLEDLSRLLRCVMSRAADDSGPQASPDLTSLARMLVAMDYLPVRFLETVDLGDLESELLEMVYKPDRLGGVREILGRIRGIAFVVRDRCSAETWTILNMLQASDSDDGPAVPVQGALARLNTLIVDLGAFSGMEMENMTRGLGWRFLDFGRRLERSDHIARLLLSSLSKHVKTSLVLEPVLEIADSSITHRRRYYAGAQLSSVLELLVSDESNPRALAFQLAAMADHIAHLPSDLPNTTGHSVDIKRTETLLQRLRRTRTWELAQAWDHNTENPLKSLLSDISLELGIISNDLSHLYFSHTVPRVS